VQSRPDCDKEGKRADFFLSQKSRDFVSHGSNNLQLEALHREFILLILMVMILLILSRVLVLVLMDFDFIAQLVVMVVCQWWRRCTNVDLGSHVSADLI